MAFGSTFRERRLGKNYVKLQVVVRAAGKAKKHYSPLATSIEEETENKEEKGAKNDAV